MSNEQEQHFEKQLMDFFKVIINKYFNKCVNELSPLVNNNDIEGVSQHFRNFFNNSPDIVNTSANFLCDLMIEYGIKAAMLRSESNVV